jgi:pyruvate/2-oxoglutarate/acetoin dehydrogenase E1 component
MNEAGQDVVQLSYAEALREGLREEMRANPDIVAYGEDFRLGYVWPVGRGLLEEFGETRIRDVPLCEQLHVGMAVGAAMVGVTAVVEIQFSDFAMLAMDEIVNQAAKLCYMSGGQAMTGLVLRLVYGHLQNFGAQHSQTPYSLFAHVPGLKVVVPSLPDDAKGLLKTAIRSGDPVAFFEHKRLYATKGNVPTNGPVIPFGRARVLREGPDATVVAIGLMVHRALEAAELLAKDGVSVTVIDPRTLVPFDYPAVVTSVRQTGRLALVDEAVLRGGYTATIAAEITRECFSTLRAAPVRIGVRDVPIPYSPPLEEAVIPSVADIVGALRGLVHDEAGAIAERAT